MTHRRSGSSPAARACTAPRPWTRSPTSRSRSSGALDDVRRASPAEVVWKPVLTDAAAIRRVMLEANADPECIGVIAWMHTFSPAKMWITGLDALRKPLLHLHTQPNVALPWASIDMDFMNLNQAAHGDREFGYIQTRLGVARKTVAGHVGRPGPGARAIDGVGPRRARAATELRRPAAGPLRRQHARRRRDRGRQGRGASCASASRSTPTGSTTWSRVVDAVADADDRRAGRPSTPTPTGWPRSCAAAATGTTSLRYAARIEAGLRDVPRRRRVRRVHHQLRGPRRAAPAARPGRAAADGRRLRLRRRGRLEDLRAAAPPSRRWAPAPAGGTSFMEDYTYHFGPGEPKILGAHMLEVCPTIAADTPSCEIHPLGIGGREDPVRLVFDAAPGPGRRDRPGRHGRPVPAGGQRDRGGRRRTSRCRSCRSPARCGSPRRRCRPRPSRGSPRAARTTPC